MTDQPESTLPKHKILFRDWKVQINAADLAEAVQEVFDGRNVPHLYDADTGQDAYAIVVSATAMTPEQVQAAWESYRDDTHDRVVANRRSP